jgi:hypothetical protein
VSWGGSLAAVWNAETGQSELTVPYSSTIREAFFDREGGRAWIRTADGWGHLWQIASGKEVRRLHADGPYRQSVDGRFLLGSAPEADGGGGQRLWDVDTGQVVGAYPNLGTNAVLAANNLSVATWSQNIIRISPTWIATQPTAERATELVTALAPLSELEQCEAYVEGADCEGRLGNTDRDTAVERDRTSPPIPSTDGPQFPDDMEDSGFNIRLVVDDAGNIDIFHNRTFAAPFKRLEYNRLTHRLGFRMKTGELRDSSVNLPARFAPALEEGHRVLMVQMDEKTNAPVGGAFFPLLVY